MRWYASLHLLSCAVLLASASASVSQREEPRGASDNAIGSLVWPKSETRLASTSIGKGEQGYQEEQDSLASSSSVRSWGAALLIRLWDGWYNGYDAEGHDTGHSMPRMLLSGEESLMWEPSTPAGEAMGLRRQLMANQECHADGTVIGLAIALTAVGMLAVALGFQVWRLSKKLAWWQQVVAGKPPKEDMPGDVWKAKEVLAHLGSLAHSSAPEDALTNLSSMLHELKDVGSAKGMQSRNSPPHLNQAPPPAPSSSRPHPLSPHQQQQQQQQQPQQQRLGNGFVQHAQGPWGEKMQQMEMPQMESQDEWRQQQLMQPYQAQQHPEIEAPVPPGLGGEPWMQGGPLQQQQQQQQSGVPGRFHMSSPGASPAAHQSGAPITSAAEHAPHQPDQAVPFHPGSPNTGTREAQLLSTWPSEKSSRPFQPTKVDAFRAAEFAGHQLQQQQQHSHPYHQGPPPRDPDMVFADNPLYGPPFGVPKGAAAGPHQDLPAFPGHAPDWPQQQQHQVGPGGTVLLDAAPATSPHSVHPAANALASNMAEGMGPGNSVISEPTSPQKTGAPIPPDPREWGRPWAAYPNDPTQQQQQQQQKLRHHKHQQQDFQRASLNVWNNRAEGRPRWPAQYDDINFPKPKVAKTHDSLPDSTLQLAQMLGSRAVSQRIGSASCLPEASQQAEAFRAARPISAPHISIGDRVSHAPPKASHVDGVPWRLQQQQQPQQQVALPPWQTQHQGFMLMEGGGGAYGGQEQERESGGEALQAQWGSTGELDGGSSDTAGSAGERNENVPKYNGVELSTPFAAPLYTISEANDTKHPYSGSTRCERSSTNSQTAPTLAEQVLQQDNASVSAEAPKPVAGGANGDVEPTDLEAQNERLSNHRRKSSSSGLGSSRTLPRLSSSQKFGRISQSIADGVMRLASKSGLMKIRPSGRSLTSTVVDMGGGSPPSGSPPTSSQLVHYEHEDRDLSEKLQKQQELLMVDLERGDLLPWLQENEDPESAPSTAPQPLELCPAHQQQQQGRHHSAESSTVPRLQPQQQRSSSPERLLRPAALPMPLQRPPQALTASPRHGPQPTSASPAVPSGMKEGNGRGGLGQGSIGSLQLPEAADSPEARPYKRSTSDVIKQGDTQAPDPQARSKSSIGQNQQSTPSGRAYHKDQGFLLNSADRGEWEQVCKSAGNSLAPAWQQQQQQLHAQSYTGSGFILSGKDLDHNGNRLPHAQKQKLLQQQQQQQQQQNGSRAAGGAGGPAALRPESKIRTVSSEPAKQSSPAVTPPPSTSQSSFLSKANLPSSDLQQAPGTSIFSVRRASLHHLHPRKNSSRLSLTTSRASADLGLPGSVFVRSTTAPRHASRSSAENLMVTDTNLSPTSPTLSSQEPTRNLSFLSREDNAGPSATSGGNELLPAALSTWEGSPQPMSTPANWLISSTPTATEIEEIKDLSMSPPPFPLAHDTPLHDQHERTHGVNAQQGAEQSNKKDRGRLSDAGALAGAASEAGLGVKGAVRGGFVLTPFSANSRELTSPFAAVAAEGSSTAGSDEADEGEVGCDQQQQQQQERQQQEAAAGGGDQGCNSRDAGESAGKPTAGGEDGDVGGGSSVAAAAWGRSESPFQGMNLSLDSCSSTSNNSREGATVIDAHAKEDGSLIELPTPPMAPANAPLPLQGAGEKQAQRPGAAAAAAAAVPHSPHATSGSRNGFASSPSPAAAAAAAEAAGAVRSGSETGAPAEPDLAPSTPLSPRTLARNRVSFKGMAKSEVQQPSSERDSLLAGSSTRSSQHSSQMGLGWLSDSPVHRLQRRGLSRRHSFAVDQGPPPQEGLVSHGKQRRYSVTDLKPRAAKVPLSSVHEQELGALPKGSLVSGAERGGGGGRARHRAAPHHRPQALSGRMSMAEEAAAAVAADAHARAMVDSYTVAGPLATRGEKLREKALWLQQHQDRDASGIMGVVTTPPAAGVLGGSSHKDSVAQQQQQQKGEEVEDATPTTAVAAAAAAEGEQSAVQLPMESSKSTVPVGTGTPLVHSSSDRSSAQRSLDGQPRSLRRGQESVGSVGGGSWLLPLSPFQMVCGSEGSSEQLPPPVQVEGVALTQAPEEGNASVELPVLYGSSPQGSSRPPLAQKEAPMVAIGQSQQGKVEALGSSIQDGSTAEQLTTKSAPKAYKPTATPTSSTPGNAGRGSRPRVSYGGVRYHHTDSSQYGPSNDSSGDESNDGSTNRSSPQLAAHPGPTKLQHPAPAVTFPISNHQPATPSSPFQQQSLQHPMPATTLNAINGQASRGEEAPRRKASVGRQGSFGHPMRAGSPQQLQQHQMPYPPQQQQYQQQQMPYPQQQYQQQQQLQQRMSPPPYPAHPHQQLHQQQQQQQYRDAMGPGQPQFQPYLPPANPYQASMQGPGGGWNGVNPQQGGMMVPNMRRWVPGVGEAGSPGNGGGQDLLEEDSPQGYQYSPYIEQEGGMFAGMPPSPPFYAEPSGFNRGGVGGSNGMQYYNFTPPQQQQMQIHPNNNGGGMMYPPEGGDWPQGGVHSFPRLQLPTQHALSPANSGASGSMWGGTHADTPLFSGDSGMALVSPGVGGRPGFNFPAHSGHNNSVFEGGLMDSQETDPSSVGQPVKSLLRGSKSARGMRSGNRLMTHVSGPSSGPNVLQHTGSFGRSPKRMLQTCSDLQWELHHSNTGSFSRLPKRMTQTYSDLDFEQKDILASEGEITVVTDYDPMLPDVSLDISLEHDITLDGTEPLGVGTHGSVFSGMYCNQPVAVKFAQFSTVDGLTQAGALETLQQEVSILSRIRHPNIVKFYGGCLHPPTVFIVEELMEKDLSSLVHGSEMLLALDDVLRIGKDIATGLFHLHPTIVHRDLKPANVLLDKRGVAKISDFGLARFKLSNCMSTKQPDAGTMAYMAPECFQENLVTPRADVYSWAIIMAEMLTGQLPWYGCPTMAIIYNVVFKQERPELPEDEERCPPDLASLIKDCWNPDPKARPGTGEVVKLVTLVMKVREHRARARSAQGNLQLRSLPSIPIEAMDSMLDGPGASRQGSSTLQSPFDTRPSIDMPPQQQQQQQQRQRQQSSWLP